MKKKVNWEKIIGTFVFITLLLSIVYSLVMLIITPDELSSQELGSHVRSDYLLMFLQCLLGLVVFALPDFLEKKFSYSFALVCFGIVACFGCGSSCRSFTFRSVFNEFHELIQFRSDDDLCTAIPLLTESCIIIGNRIVLTTAGGRKSLGVYTILILQSLYNR